MNRFVILLGLLCSALLIRAQQHYFIFLQSDNNQPYYVQIQEKTFSSSSIGHLIISSLPDSVYKLTIGFPKDRFPEQIFEVRINKRDAGYQIKNMGNEGWALFNLQTLQLIKAQAAESKKQTIAYGDIKKTDVFSTLMAGLVNDSAVLYASIAKTEPPKDDLKSSSTDNPEIKGIVVRNEETPRQDTAVAGVELGKEGMDKKDTQVTRTEIAGRQEILKKDSVVITTGAGKRPGNPGNDTVTTSPLKPKNELTRKNAPGDTSVASHPPAHPDSLDIKQTITNGQAPEKNSVMPKRLIVRLGETAKEEGTEITFFDMSYDDRIDTIKILIPKVTGVAPVVKNEEKEARGEVKSGVDTEAPEKEKSKAGRLIGKIFGKKNSSGRIKEEPADKSENTSSIKVSTVDEGKPVATKPVDPKKAAVTNSDCRNSATDNDVERLRLKMLGEKDADGQVSEARKVFKIKCFSTQQIKVLSELFRTDEGKYKLFDAAYPFVSDTGNFKDLAGLLSDEYYINRFKAMVRL